MSMCEEKMYSLYTKAYISYSLCLCLEFHIIFMMKTSYLHGTYGCIQGVIAALRLRKSKE